MLKFIISIILIRYSIKNWTRILNLLFIITFLFGLRWVGHINISLLRLGIGVDSIGFILILLRFWITALVIGGRQKIYDSSNFEASFLLINVLLLLSLVLTFSCSNYLLFYICFERSLIPTLVLILGWGYQPERLQAGIYILFYTLFASLPLLVSLIRLSRLRGSLTLGLVNLNQRLSFINYIWYICTVFAFVVKLPIFIVHLWLPKAHVEAPVAGSIILAGVLLKLGGYGLIRVLPLFPLINKEFTWVWLRLGIVGGLLVSLICLRQTDVKALIAYSSVAHIGLVLCGLILFRWWGLGGAIAVIIGHGLCSSGLFCIANMAYERVGRRSLLVRKGLLNFIPRMGLWWFLLRAGNMAAPPTLNLLGEIRLIISVVRWSHVSIVAVGLLSFFRASYRLYLYSLSQHGKYFRSLFSCCSGKVREYIILILHWLPLNMLILKSNTIIYLI